MLAWPCVKFSILTLFFVDIFLWSLFQEQVGQIRTISSGHNGKLPQCAPLYDNDTESIFWHFISKSFHFTQILFWQYCLKFILKAGCRTFFLCTLFKKICLPSVLHLFSFTYISPNVPYPSSQCAPGMGHIGTVEIHFLKCSHTNHVCTTMYKLTHNMGNMFGFSEVRYY